MSDDPRLPDSLHSLAHLFGDELRRVCGDHLVGAYFNGSIALGAFDSTTSDVDFVVLLDREPDRDLHRQLARLHRRVRRVDRFGRRLEGMYVSVDHLHTHDLAARHIYVKGGRMRGTHRLPIVARMLLRRGVPITGPDPAHLLPEVDPALIVDEMLWNLRVYWRGRLKRPWLFLSDEVAEFALTTVARIRHTLATGEIVSKRRAVELLAASPGPWRDLAGRLRGEQGGRVGRARKVMAFVRSSIADVE